MYYVCANTYVLFYSPVFMKQRNRSVFASIKTSHPTASVPMQYYTAACLLSRFSCMSHISPLLLTSNPLPYPCVPTHVLLHPAKGSLCAMESGITNKTQLVVFIVGSFPPRLSYSCQIRHAFPPVAKARPL